ncbi:PAP2 superfamily phosphatase [Candidatus Trichorickettsia mobilis]|uniref:PAP2 superfamily phosphatase n=1 Tax=Candidatus Trichorickettsia mobilis TaxID=1346319 RepID=A0ABZ0USU7_9RICK|nr:phosphatase PAP2 family protein [Candidatus Trichorickettsia mobilis]WPY00280.1 PAP2 superfamily phosphatase [Candidatus Trichorickettsia mobilis]
MINNRLIYINIILSGILFGLLVSYPALDLKFSQLFYDHDHGFIYRNNFVVRFLFLLIPPLTKIFVAACIIFFCFQRYKHKNFKKTLSSWIAYLIIAVTIGPGLIVNQILKNDIGRARPSQITEFGGSKNFTAAAIITDQCHYNCSFPSGHAAMAYYYTILAYTTLLFSNKNKKYFTIIYISALLFGTLTGLSRILMGGHFLSDVIASCFIILTINHLLFLWWQKQQIA